MTSRAGHSHAPSAADLGDTGSRAELHYSREAFDQIPLPAQTHKFPELRFMGSKHRLLPWIHGVLRELVFDTAADPFVGSGGVAYLLRSWPKVFTSDFLNFPAVLAHATVANSRHRLGVKGVQQLLAPRRKGPHFIEKTFADVFFASSDLQFLDRVSANVGSLANLLRRYKSHVTAFERPHRYHFGTHRKVERAVVNEFLIVGQ